MSEFLQSTGESAPQDTNADQNDQSSKWTNFARSIEVKQPDDQQSETEPESSSTPVEDAPAEAEPQGESEAQAEAEESSEAKEQIEGNIYDYEYRRKVNEPVHDLFAKRRSIILKAYPALDMSLKDLGRYCNDSKYQAERQAEIDKVPKEVKDEFYLMARLMGRLRDGIAADLTPGHEWAGSEPNYVPKEVKTETITVVSTVWKASETEIDLARLQELHEKSSEFVDFSHEDEENIETVPGEIEQSIAELKEEIKSLDTANFSDFRSWGDERPKTSAIFDKIFGIRPTEQMSLEKRAEITRARKEFEKQYVLAELAAEIRDIDSNIAQLQADKEEIATRQEKIKKANSVTRFFLRLTRPNLEDELDNQYDRVSSIIGEQQKRVDELRDRIAS